MVNVEQLLRRLAIEARRGGKEWSALCPNPDHNDRNPSWRIRDDPTSDRHGMHHCFACGFGGSAIDLVMAVQRLSYREALAYLDGEGISNKEVPRAVEIRSSVARRFSLPGSVSTRPYSEWKQKRAGLYLQSRQITDRQVERWKLSYAIDGRLANRIIVPYFDKSGELRNYNARSYVGAEPKYMQPDRLENPDRGVVFGEQFWPDYGVRDGVFVTEGEFNALAVERALGEGVAVAALSGSQLSAIQVAKLASFRKLWVLSDPDAAGDKLYATMCNQLERHVKLVRVWFPPGADANSLRVEVLRYLLKGAL